MVIMWTEMNRQAKVSLSFIYGCSMYFMNAYPERYTSAERNALFDTVSNEQDSDMLRYILAGQRWAKQHRWEDV